MDLLAVARRRAFSFWLRTGRLPRWAQPPAPEVKYNPWHDPDDGRFTFAGTGRYFRRGGSGGDRARTPSARMAEKPKEPKEAFGGYGGGGHRLSGGGASGSWKSPEADPRQSRKRSPQPDADLNRAEQIGPQSNPRPGRHPIDDPRTWRRVDRNGYIYRIDAWGRTRRISGLVVENQTQSRSRSAQAIAGIPDRRTSDHGGHYIARRFNGPTDAFNHFAQDANFNRGEYRSLENQWARAVRAGKRVRVIIEPSYDGTSRRPSMIKVSYWIDGPKRTVRFPNEPRESRNAKR